MFRVLDLGSHDGFVSLWLARQLREQGHDVRVDGVELNVDAVAIAQRRFDEEKIPATFVEGNALDVEQAFEPGTYDAVICFELIEHVADMNELLAVCEAMLKADGRIYVSTPNGVFGEGSNPHHLRAMSAHDLTELIRRRGELADGTVGSDGVTTIAYTPRAKQGEIAIFTGPALATWSPLDIERSGLGGSETAAVRLAEQLAELDYVVTVYGEVEQCQFRDVAFVHWQTFDPTERRLCVISSRMPEIFDRPINSRVRMLWMHDTDCGTRLTGKRAEQVDHVLALSRWHSDHLGGTYRTEGNKVRRIRNGIHPPYFKSPLDEPRAQRLIYTSSPDRGLDVLLEIWPRIKEKAPDAVFAYCYPGYFDAAADADPQIGAFRDRIKELSDQPGVQPLGGLPQPELVRLMRTSMVWAHPSWNTIHGMPFHETSCIGAMEAQAAGCLVVASHLGALPETIRVGRILQRDVGGPEWRTQFVNCILEGLEIPEVQEWAQAKGPENIDLWGWSGVAEQVVQLINGEYEGFEHKRTPMIQPDPSTLKRTPLATPFQPEPHQDG